MYRNDWHARHRERTRRAATLILQVLTTTFPVHSIVDVGCGHGDWLKEALELGVDDVVGCDGPWIDKRQLVIPQSYFQCEQIDRPLKFGRVFDLALCTEVGEHLPLHHADDLVLSIVRHTDLALFGAAIPHQGGYRHVNEQWQSWWAGRFAAHGFAPFDIIRPLIWDQPVDFWYKQNTLVYVRASNEELSERARASVMRILSRPLRLDIVHPQKYMDVATYNSIAFRPFIKSFPHAVWHKLKAAAGVRGM